MESLTYYKLKQRFCEPATESIPWLSPGALSTSHLYCQLKSLPGINDVATLLSDDFVQPFPGLVGHRLPSDAQHLQGRSGNRVK